MVAACTKASSTQPSPSAGARPSDTQAGKVAAEGIFKLDHLVFIVMENRSFDHYCGKYPGADGIPRKVCVPHPALGGRCMSPYHDEDTVDIGGPHTAGASETDVNGGKMDGFIQSVVQQDENPCASDPKAAGCADRVGPQGQPEVMGYHTREEIPNYWEYADNFALQDRMFAPTDSWTLPSHLFLVSAWSGICPDHDDPMSCRPSLGGDGEKLEMPANANDTPYAWTDITHLLHEAGVSWGYFVAPGPTCYEKACDREGALDLTTGFQNPMPGFLTVKENGQRKNILTHDDYFEAADSGDLPSVSWVMPSIGQSEHPAHGDIDTGQEFVTQVVNATMEGPDWDSTAIFLTWDDWGGFYDHVPPTEVDELGYGIRVPGLMMSPYAKEGYIDSQTLTFDAYLKLIEDRFLGGQRLDPKTDGRPDPRTVVREDLKVLGDLTEEFDFDQDPRPPLILDPNPG